MIDELADAPRVSIVLPTFNRADLVGQAIESVIRQDYDAWELLVVDDGSTDETETVLATYASDERIRCFRQPNSGQASARNLGIRHARGAWIAFIDSDDRWLPHKLRQQMTHLSEHPEVDVVYGEAERIDLDGQVLPIRSRMRKYSGEIWRPLLYDNFVGMSTVVVRAAKLREVGGFDEKLRRVEDYDLWLRLSATCLFDFLPGVVSQYRVAGGRVSDDVAGCADSNLSAVERFLATHPDLLSPRELATVRGRLYGRIAREYSHEGMFWASLSHAVSAIRSAPESLSEWRTMVAVLVKPVRRLVKGSRDSTHGD